MKPSRPSLLLGWLRALTVEQWRLIDEAYRDPSRPPSHAAWVLVTVAVAVTFERFWGSPESYRELGEIKRLFAWIPSQSLRPHAWWSTFKILTSFVLPALCIKLALRSSLREHGWAMPPRRAWIVVGIVLLVMLPVVVGASTTTLFQNAYPRYRPAGASPGQFAGWIALYAFQFLMLEFFYRGFLIFALARHMGSTAIFVMAVPYTMIHFVKPLPEALGSIVAGIALGTLALRTRSILGPFVIHFGVALMLDVLVLLQRGSFARMLQ